MARLTCWTVGANPVPLLTCVGGTVVLTEIDQFTAHDLEFAAADARTIQAMKEWTLLELVQEGVGTIGYGYVVNPRQSVSDQGAGTIRVSLEQLTHELTWHRTRRGWQAQNNISIVQARLAALAPGWTGVFTDLYTVDPQGNPRDLTVQVTLNNPTALGGYLQLAQQFSQHARLGTLVDATGNPARILEMGQFGAAPTVTLQDAKGGDLDAMGRNTTMRVPASVEWQPNNVEDFCNVTVPFGGGQDTDSLVTLERLWRIINDPAYPDVGRYGSDADSTARTGRASLFPEYDPAYPITDPEHPPTGTIQYDAQGNLLQGAYNTRGVTLDGHYDYIVYDAASYATYGHKETKDYIDSSLTYPSADPADQVYTARALYVSVVGFFKRYAHPHHAFTCTVNDANTLPTRAGDLVATDFQHVSVAENAAVVEMNITESMRVMQVTRAFNGDDPAVDTYTLSNLGRFDATDATGAADTAQTIVALQRQQGTGLAPYTRDFAGNIDVANPITVSIYVPQLHFRWHEFRVQCDWLPFRGTATTAHTIQGSPIVTVGAVEILIATPADINAVAANIGGIPDHVHGMAVLGNTRAFTISSTPATISPNNYLWVGGSGTNLVLNANSLTGTLYTGTPPGSHQQVNLDPTAHPHVVKKQGETVGHLPAGTVIGPVPDHAHDVEKRIPTGQPAPASITLTINGVSLSSGASVQGTRDPLLGNAFTSAFVANDISVEMEAAGRPGSVVPLRFDAGTSAGNPFGVGFLQISVTAVEELGGLASTFRAS